MMILRKTICLLFLVSLAISAFAAAPSANKVEGTYMVDGKVTQLKYAYAVKETSDSKPFKAVLLSAAPVPDATLKSEDLFSTFSDLAREGKLQAVEVVFEDSKKIRGIRIYDKAFDGALQTGVGDKFEGTKFDAVGVAGKIDMAKPDNFFKQTYQYNATFSVSW
jgi:hypothetical protein